MGKYDGKEFNDPIVRCTECQEINWRIDLAISGQCSKCGGKRMRNVSRLTSDEVAILKDQNIDPEFLATFSGPKDGGE